MIADSDRSAAVLLKEKLDEAQAETQRRVNEALANSDACWRMEQEVIVRQRDEALAQVARREREHEALLETAQKALARVEAEQDGARAELEGAKQMARGWEEVYRTEHSLRRETGDKLDEARADVKRLRAEWQRDLDGCNTIIDRLKAEVDRLRVASVSRKTSCSAAEFSERQRIVAWIRARHALGSMDCSLSLMALDALRVVADEIERREHSK